MVIIVCFKFVVYSVIVVVSKLFKLYVKWKLHVNYLIQIYISLVIPFTVKIIGSTVFEKGQMWSNVTKLFFSID